MRRVFFFVLLLLYINLSLGYFREFRFLKKNRLVKNDSKPPGRFPCPFGLVRCNGTRACPNGSDKNGCSKPTPLRNSSKINNDITRRQRRRIYRLYETGRAIIACPSIQKLRVNNTFIDWIQIEWKRVDERPMPKKYKVDGTWGSLIIDNLNFNHSGMYWCKPKKLKATTIRCLVIGPVSGQKHLPADLTYLFLNKV